MPVMLFYVGNKTLAGQVWWIFHHQISRNGTKASLKSAVINKVDF